MIANGISVSRTLAAISTGCELTPPLSYPVWFNPRMNTMQKMLFRPNLVMDNAGPVSAMPVGFATACEPKALELRDALREDVDREADTACGRGLAAQPQEVVGYPAGQFGTRSSQFQRTVGWR